MRDEIMKAITLLQGALKKANGSGKAAKADIRKAVDTLTPLIGKSAVGPEDEGGKKPGGGEEGNP
jgi:hypothetical protein